jgi:hypothetical protein
MQKLKRQNAEAFATNLYHKMQDTRTKRYRVTFKPTGYVHPQHLTMEEVLKTYSNVLTRLEMQEVRG